MLKREFLKIRVPAEYKTALGRDKQTVPAGGGDSFICVPDDYLSVSSASRRTDVMYFTLEEIVQTAGMFDIDLPAKFEETLAVYSNIYIELSKRMAAIDDEEIERRVNEGGEREDNDSSE